MLIGQICFVIREIILKTSDRCTKELDTKSLQNSTLLYRVCIITQSRGQAF